MPRPSLNPGLLTRAIFHSSSKSSPSSATILSLLRAQSQCHTAIPRPLHHRAYTRRLLTTINSSTPYPEYFQPPKRQWPRRLRIALYILIFGSLGYTAASIIDILPSGVVFETDSPEDLEIRAILREDFDRLDIVDEYRSNPDYVEWEPYMNFTEEERMNQLTSGSLKGSRGLSTQRIFYNEKENSATSIVFLGNGIDGWPGVVHGGALATILDECMGRVAFRSFKARTGINVRISLDYKRPVSPGQFVLVKAQHFPEKSWQDGPTTSAVIVDEDGNVCTEATGWYADATHPDENLTPKELGDGF